MRAETIAALEASNQRLRDLVRYKRMELFEDGLIDEKEYSELLTNTPGAVSRLEGYDKINAQLAEVRKLILSGFTYDPGHSDLDDEQPITVRMTLGDYRKVRNMR